MLANEFAAKVRAAHPGAYDTLPDEVLVDRVLRKFPQYRSQVTDPSYTPMIANEEGEQPTGPTGQGLGTPEQQIDFERGGFNKFSTAPVEQRLATNAVDVGNAAQLGYSLPGMAAGIAGLGMKGLGAISEGLSGPMEGASNWLGSRVLRFAKSALPESATAAKGVVDDATQYAMNPHPEIQQAIMDIGSGAPKSAPVGAAEGAAQTSTSLVKRGGEVAADTGLVPESKALESTLKSDGPTLEGEVVNPPEFGEPAAPESGEVSADLGSFDTPILSMSNMTTASQLAHTEHQVGTVGNAIDSALEELNQTGSLYDPATTAKQLANMYQRNASGQVIPAGSGSQQALYNQAVNRAIETLKANALDDNGVLQKLDWQQANGIKKALSDLAEYGLKDNDPVNMVYQQAAKAVRDSIDDQAQPLLAAQGRDVNAFQALRDAYHQLKGVQGALNAKALSEMSAKNVVPVIRTLAAAGGAVTGHPALVGLAAADYVGREFGPIMAARAFKNAAGAPAAAAEAGANLVKSSGGVSNAARGIASGLALGAGD